MKKTIDGKRYDTQKCERLGKIDHYSYSNNYAGTTSLLLASDGQMLVHCNANGQDINLRNYMIYFDESELSIDDFDLTEDQEKRCSELGLIEIIS